MTRRRRGPSPSDWAYRWGRFSRDVKAVSRGKLVKRILRRTIGRRVNRATNRWLS